MLLSGFILGTLAGPFAFLQLAKDRTRSAGMMKNSFFIGQGKPLIIVYKRTKQRFSILHQHLWLAYGKLAIGNRYTIDSIEREIAGNNGVADAGDRHYPTRSRTVYAAVI